MTIRALAPLLLLAAASPAGAGTIELVPTCVAVDQKDTLAPLERTQAVTILRHVLEEQDLLVVDSGCVDTYTLLHERDGAEMIVHVRGPHGGRKLHVAGMGDLAGAYEKMVRALREPPPPTPPPSASPQARAVDRYGMAVTPPSSVAPVTYTPPADLEDPTATATVPATAPTAEPTVPDPVVAQEPVATPYSHNVFYVQLGVGGMGGADSPRSFSGGYRYEHTGTVFDAAATGFGSDSAGTQVVSGSRIAAKVLRELTPERSSSLYVGGGLGISGSTIQLQSTSYAGSGLEGVATVGADIRRDRSGLRMFVQADVILPFYMMQNAMTSETEYAGSVMFSLGFGLGGR